VALSTYQLLVICASVKIPHIYLYKFTGGTDRKF
jgi:hypothetical protein